MARRLSENERKTVDLIRRRDEMLMSYAHFRLNVLRRAYAGAKASQPDKAAEMAREIDVWEEIVSC